MEKELSLVDSIKLNNLCPIYTSSLLKENPSKLTEFSSHIGPYVIPYYPSELLESQLNSINNRYWYPDA